MQKENAKKSSIRSKPHNNVYGLETQGRWTYENSQSFEEAMKINSMNNSTLVQMQETRMQE